MKIRTSIYVPAESVVHACDARVKVALLLMFTICVFLVETWAGLLAFAAATLLVILASRVPLRSYFGTLVPVYVLMGFTVLFNLFSGEGALLALGPLTVYASGLSRGAFFALRILLLCVGSMVVCYTTTSTSLTAALGWAIGPLRRVKVPVDDIVTVLSIALRFIPLLAAEVERVHDAHWSRGARFDGGLGDKLSAWGKVFIAVFVGIFRRADRLSAAMDARCYGLPGVARTPARVQTASATSLVFLVVGLAFFVAAAILL